MCDKVVWEASVCEAPQRSVMKVCVGGACWTLRCVKMCRKLQFMKKGVGGKCVKRALVWEGGL